MFYIYLYLSLYLCVYVCQPTLFIPFVTSQGAKIPFLLSRNYSGMVSDLPSMTPLWPLCFCLLQKACIFKGGAVNRGLKTPSPGDQQNSSLSFLSFGMKSSHLEIRFDQFDQQTRSPLCVEFLCNFHRLFGGYSKFPRCQFLEFLQTRKNMTDCFIIRRAGRV